MLAARITFDRTWRWRGIGIYARTKRLGPVDRLPGCLNAKEVAGAILRVGAYRRLIRMLADYPRRRWSGRFRIEVDARGRTIFADAHAYDFGFPELGGIEALLKKLRFEPARRNGRAANYDFAANVALSSRPKL